MLDHSGVIEAEGETLQVTERAAGFVGRPVMDLLRGAHLPCRLVPVTITGGDRESCDAGTWRVPKRDLITGLLVLFQRGKIDICGHLPESETLVKELANIRIKVSLGGHDTYGAWRKGSMMTWSLPPPWLAGRHSLSIIPP